MEMEGVSSRLKFAEYVKILPIFHGGSIMRRLYLAFQEKILGNCSWKSEVSLKMLSSQT